MFKKPVKKHPTPDQAQAYVHKGIHGVGGLTEAWGGLIHKTIPAVTASWSSVNFGSGVAFCLAFILRVLIIAATALFPLLVRKVTTSTSTNQAPAPASGVLESVNFIMQTVVNATSIDYALGLLALVVVGAPKLLDMFGTQAKVERHSPFFDLTAAIKKLPIQNQPQLQDTDDAIRLTLLALREEMALLIGDVSSQRLTDVTLLEFCDDQGTRMQVRARTANHEEVGRPVESSKFVAYYVALEGRNFAEQDFKNKRNPFPPKRVSVRGNHDVDYRSVLYLPIVCSETVAPPDGVHGAPQVIDSCAGVICVHSSKAYRFWRWGDHKKGVGGFADVAFSRSMPYIAIIQQLLSRTVPRVKLEAK